VNTVKSILADKGSHVWSVGPGATVLDAALLMNEHKIGALVVMEGGRLAGIFTERDVLRRVVGEARDPARTQVADVMSGEVVCCSPETTLEEARGVMKNRRIRHLPVLDADGRLLGLVSIGDLNARMEHAQEQHIHLLNEYLYGRV
jgi:CBS domain-containing protein